MSDQNTTMRPDSPLNQKSKRKSGFYWVRFSSLSDYEIAKWVPNHGWSMFWIEEYLKDSRLHYIDERPIVRDEPKHPNYTGSAKRITMTRAEKLDAFFKRDSRMLRVCPGKPCACGGCVDSLRSWWLHFNPNEAPITKEEMDEAMKKYNA